MKKSFLFSVLVFISSSLIAQKEANIWYFGNNAGVDFVNGSPLAITNGSLKTDEGCTVISDKDGALLFYSDGITVWDRNHREMINGTGLKGHPSSTSSGVAIPKPNYEGIYYLFTVSKEATEDGLCYSLVDMSLNSGLGDVVESEKNVKIESSVTEKITAVGHRNGKDIWVIAHQWESDEFLAYLVSENGVEKQPIVSKVGSIHGGKVLNTQGYLKGNPDGSNLAMALEADQILELFDFDNSTGKVSKPIKVIFPEASYIYGIEFSPNGSLLYVSAAGVGEIYQFNLQLETDEEIQKSMLKVGASPNKKWIGALQIANDGKIYFPIYDTPFLGVIHEPNVLGEGCKYENNFVELKGKIAKLGLPTFLQNFFIEETIKEEVVYFDEAKVELNKAIILKNINFDFAKYTLQPSSFFELDKVVDLMKKNPTYKIHLTGHTDNIGNKSANLTLSIDRAKSVSEYLSSKGIDAERITSEGFGSSSPIASNLEQEGRDINRRVEFFLIDKSN